MKAEVLSVGTELLLGQIVDTNAAYLAQQLSTLGIDLFHVTQVGDNLGRLVDALRRAWDRSDLLVLTGGVGPTEDDLTREAIAELLGEQMAVQPDLRAELLSFYTRRNMNMPPSNIKQAMLIPSARAIPNPVGTAPGWRVEKDGRVIVAMPGVPSEMKLMWESQVVPFLQEKQGGTVILTRNLKVIGLGESLVEEMIRPLLASTNPTIATYAKADGVHVRISAKAEGTPAAEALIATMEAKVRPILGTAIYGLGEETLEATLLDLLRSCGLTLATMEEFTGGLVAAALSTATGAPDSPYLGGLVATSPAAQAAWGLAPVAGLPDAERASKSASEMAGLARRHFGADVGVAAAATESASADGTRSVRTYYVAVDDRGDTEVSNGMRRSTLPEFRRFVVLQALAAARKRLLAGV